jgi:hypothetical protein
MKCVHILSPEVVPHGFVTPLASALMLAMPAAPRAFS